MLTYAKRPQPVQSKPVAKAKNANPRRRAPTSQALERNDPVVKLSAPSIQAKLDVSEPGDALEQEADRAAEQVMRALDDDVTTRGPKSSVGVLRKAGSISSSGAAPDAVSATLGSEGALAVAHNSSSEPLSGPLRERMERGFGRSFSDVRVHRDAVANQLTSALEARAFAIGRHVFFRGGQFEPDNNSGRRLIAHELAHVLQQGLGPTNVARWPWSKRVHSSDELADARSAFMKKNDHLTEDQVRKIANAVTKVAVNASTFEVLFEFFDYYSGIFGQKIVLMTPEEEAEAKKHDQWASTTPSGDTRVRSDVFGFDDARLGGLLLHELTHTGHATNVLGLGDVQEGQSYAIEYFYAEKSGDKQRMDSIIKIMRAGSVALPALKQALQDTFLLSYAVMSSLQQLIKTGKSPYSTLPNLTSNDGELLSAEFVTHFKSPGKQLQQVIDYVTNNPPSVKLPPL